MTGSFEVLEHTADVGLRARGGTLEEAFAAAGEGLAHLLGAWFPGEGEERGFSMGTDDREGLLVAWLDEILYLHEAEDLVFGGIRVTRVSDWDPGAPMSCELEALLTCAPRGERELEGVGVKAATFHELRVAEEGGEWVAQVYLDV